MATERPVSIPLGPGAAIAGDLAVPDAPAGLVIFAHGSGSSRHSPRNRAVAEFLNDAGFATLLIDLLAGHEDTDDNRRSHPKWDIDDARGAARSGRAVDPAPPPPRSPPGRLLRRQHRRRGGAGRGGPSPTADRRRRLTRRATGPGRRRARQRSQRRRCCIVGSRDVEVLELNRQAARLMHAEVRLEVVAGATHLFPEAGALEEVARLATDWFAAHLHTASEAKSRP